MGERIRALKKIKHQIMTVDAGGKNEGRCSVHHGEGAGEHLPVVTNNQDKKERNLFLPS